MTKKKEQKEVRIVPTYKFVEVEGADDITPVKRQIAKTHEVTETFTYYDALTYKIKLEKAIADKLSEVDGYRVMLKAYEEELALIEDVLHVDEFDRKWNLELHEKLKLEELQKQADALMAEPKPEEPETV
jgi:hypothetical protein